MSSGFSTPANAHTRTGVGIAVIFAAILLSACSTVKISGDSFIVPDKKLEANRRPVPSRDLEPLRARVQNVVLDEVIFHAPDGQPLHGLRHHNASARATVLVFGNNAFRVAQQGHVILQALAPLPLNIVQFDYRGYGRSEGEPTVTTVQADALAVYDQLRANVKGPLIVHGHSFGSFVASYVASLRQPDALVLEGSSTSAVDFVHSMTPWYAKPFVRIEIEDALRKFDNRAYLRNYKGRVLILVGQNDQTTPVYQAKALLDAIPSDAKLLVEVPNADHMSAMRKEQAKAAYAALLNTLTSSTAN